MKTIVTIILALTTTLCFSQEIEKELNLSLDTKKDLKEVFKMLSQKLEDIDQKEFFTKPEMVELQTKIAEANSRISHSFENRFFKNDSLHSNTSRKVRLTINVDEASEVLAQFENTDFEALEKTLNEVATAIEKSPKIAELALRLKKLEEKYNKNN